MEKPCINKVILSYLILSYLIYVNAQQSVPSEENGREGTSERSSVDKHTFRLFSGEE